MAYQGNITRYYLYTALTSCLLWLPVWVVFLTQRGLSLGQIGTLELVAILLLAICEVPTGIVADTWGRTVSMAIGAAMHGLALLGLLTAVLSPVFLLAYALWGISFSFVSGAGEAFAYDSLKADGMTDAYPRVASRLALIRQAAAGASGLVGGLVAAIDLRLCFVLTAGACLAGAGVILTGREPPRDEATVTDATGYRATLVQAVHLAVRRPRVRYIILIGAVVHLFTILLTMTAFQPYATEVDLPIWTFGSLVLGIQLCSMGGSAVSVRLATRLGRDRLLVLALGGIAGFQVLLWLGASRPAIILFAAAAAVGALVQPVLSTMLNDAIPSRQRATIISLQSLVAMVGLGVVQFGLFAIGERTGMALALGCAGLVMAALVVPLLTLLNRAPADAQGSNVAVD